MTFTRPTRLHATALTLLLAVSTPVHAAGILDDVPDIKAVTDYQPKIPLRVYSADKVLIGEFGAERREFVPIAKIPHLMKAAVLAIEDARFYTHGGIDWIRALGAAKANLSGSFRQGGSTITMQVARNFFLTRDKTLPRKLTEVALAYKIEEALSKDQILEVYLNQIYLGQRAYGFSSAARTYFGKRLDQLTLAETAMLAGLPQNPSRHNPVANPERAQARQRIVLRRMFELNNITEKQYRAALAETLIVQRDGGGPLPGAEYVAELARQAAHARFGQAAYERGYSVTTTINAAEQRAAYEGVRRSAIAYDRRHGYRGPEARIKLPAAGAEREEAIADALQKRPAVDGFTPAVVLSASAKRVRVTMRDGDTVEISGAGLGLAAPALSNGAKATLRLTPGAVVRISRAGKSGWAIAQVPQVAAAFVALDVHTGAYRAMVGGFDYGLQKFNHVTQAWRQPGSAIKPFVYSAALEHGFFPGTQILDEPIDFTGEQAYANWSPRNDHGGFEGPVTVRYALAHSKNVPAVRLLRTLEVDYTRTFMQRFGFDPARHPNNLTLALGSGAVTPVQLAGAYAVVANGGYRIAPHLITGIQDRDGKPVAEFRRAPLDESARVLDARNAFITDSMLRDVTRYGTGAETVRQLRRGDIAGKTGTTSNAIDGWFAGYGGKVVAVAWMGYDEPRSLGSNEYGSTVAMPVWIDYMRVALAKTPERAPPVPEGVAKVGEDWVYAEFAEQAPVLDVQPSAPEQDGVAPVGAQLP